MALAQELATRTLSFEQESANYNHIQIYLSLADSNNLYIAQSWPTRIVLIIYFMLIVCHLVRFVVIPASKLTRGHVPSFTY